MSLDLQTIGVAFETAGLEKGQAALKKTEEAANRTADAADKVTASAKKTAVSIEEVGRKARTSANDAETLTASLAKIAVRGGAVAGTALAVGAVGKALFDASAAAQRLNVQLNFASGGNGARELAFVTGLANRLGLEMNSTAQAYAGFASAARGTALEGSKTRDVFEAIAKANAVMGLSADQSRGALLAVQQMMSKGTVQAEEFRGQLGERMPIALQAGAKALGVTTAEFGKMMEAGQIVAEDFLPKFAAALNSMLGDSATQAANRLDAATARMGNSWQKLKQVVGDSGISQAIAGGMKFVSDDMQAISEAMDRAKHNGGGFFMQMNDGLGMLIGRAVGLAYVNRDFRTLEQTVADATATIKRLDEQEQKNGKLSIYMMSERATAARDLAAANRELALSGGGSSAASVTQEGVRASGMGRERYLAQRAKDEESLTKIRNKIDGVPDGYAKDMIEIIRLNQAGLLVGKEYNDVLAKQQAMLFKKTGQGPGKVDVAQRLVELRLQQTVAQQDLSVTRERLSIEQSLARLKLDSAGGLPVDYVAAKRAELQNQELNAKQAGLTIDLAAARAAETTAKREDDKIQAATKRLGIEMKLEEIAIQRLGIDDGSAAAEERKVKAIAEGQKFLSEQRRQFQDAAVTQGQSMFDQARDARIGNMPNRARAQAILEVEDAAQRKIIDINYTSAQRAQEVWAQYFDWYKQRGEDLAAQFASGPMAGIDAYLRSIQDVGKQTADVWTRGFESMEDALTQFVTTGKLDFKSLANSIISGMVRIQIQQSITGPLAQAYKTGGISGAGGVLAWLGIGGGGGSLSAIGNMGDLSILPGAANGGYSPPNSFREVNERGPELLTTGGRQFLMMGGQGGSVTPNGGRGGAVVSLSTTVNIDSRSDRAEVYANVGRAIADNNQQFVEQLRQHGVIA